MADVKAEKPEIYFSVDVEADGPSPYENSMLSIGAVAYNQNGDEVGSFTVNLEPIPDHVQNSKTMEWWQTQPAAWAALQKDRKAPQIAMQMFDGWVKSFNCRPVFVAYPASYDFTMIYCYSQKFLGGYGQFKWYALDMRSYAAALLGSEYSKTNYDKDSPMPPGWFSHNDGEHIAINDARVQGQSFVKMLQTRRGLGKLTFS